MKKAIMHLLGYFLAGCGLKAQPARRFMAKRKKKVEITLLVEVPASRDDWNIIIKKIHT